MTEFEEIILAELAALRAEVAKLTTGSPAASRAAEFESLPASSTVGKDYVAWRFGCSERAVVRGEAGTGSIRRVGRKPLKFIKKDVDAAWRDYTKTAKEIAAEIKGRPVRRKSLIRRAA